MLERHLIGLYLPRYKRSLFVVLVMRIEMYDLLLLRWPHFLVCLAVLDLVVVWICVVPAVRLLSKLWEIEQRLLLYVLTIRVIGQSIEIARIEVLRVVFYLDLPSEQMLVPLELLIQFVYVLFVGLYYLLSLRLILHFPALHGWHFVLELKVLLAKLFVLHDDRKFLSFLSL